MGQEQEVGKVLGYFGKLGVAAVEASGEFAIGDMLHFKGHTTDFSVKVESMQADNQPVSKAAAGMSVGIKIPEKARHGDAVYRVI